MEILTDANRAHKVNMPTLEVKHKNCSSYTDNIHFPHVSSVAMFYLWICRLRQLSGSLSCWDGWALQQMVMMGLAKMKQTIEMEMIYHT